MKNLPAIKDKVQLTLLDFKKSSAYSHILQGIKDDTLISPLNPEVLKQEEID